VDLWGSSSRLGFGPRLQPGESLIFFVLRLIERLRAMGPAPAADLMQYTRSLRSFRK
jgi:hypothetical protein